MSTEPNPGTQHGLEIGALCNPIVPPGAGHIEYVDHLPTEELRKKYATDPNVDVARIVTVNYVWGECTLPEVVGDRRFDYVIASHVVEHVPDPIGWLREIAAVLSPGGMLSLAIPDKRWTFDCRREVTSVSEMIESYFEHRRRPTIRHCVEQFGEAAKVPGAVSAADLWQGKVSFDQIPLMTPGLLEHLGEAGMRSYFDAFRSGTYLDAHCSVFTPFSFVRILAVAKTRPRKTVRRLLTTRRRLLAWRDNSRWPKRAGGKRKPMLTVCWLRRHGE